MQDYLRNHIRRAIRQIAPGLEIPPVTIEKPKSPSHGDAACNVALMLAKPLSNSPRTIARQIADAIPLQKEYLDSIEVAGPGFINFRFSNEWLKNQLVAAYKAGKKYGQLRTNSGKHIQVEFVSANPTGPLTVGHGRNAVLGDTLARLLEHTGAKVEREYYFNNAGRQMRILAESVRARYLQCAGLKATLPEDGYEGSYITDIAQSLFKEKGEQLNTPNHHSIFKEIAEKTIFEDIQQTLGRLNIRMDSFFNENTLYEDGSIKKVLKKLRDAGLVYDKEGATWFRTTSFGKDKDTVLIKSSGEPTYRLPDIAYHINKLERGFGQVVDIFGADHIATYPDVVAAVKACGYDSDRIRVIVYQFVTIVKDGKPYKMSTRKANYVTLDELMDEVGVDVTRFFFLMRAPGTHLEFDIAEARQAGEKNPVFYLQYAHARIHSIMRKVNEVYTFPERHPDFALLKQDTEVSLVKRVLEFPDTVNLAASNFEPHKMITYLNDLATAFHRFYHDCRILGENEDLAMARTGLLGVTANVLAGGLNILGISAPKRM